MTSIICRIEDVSQPDLSPIAIFVYDFHMREDEIDDAQIQAWADEAEAGYDVEALKRRGRGRPGRGAEPMQVVAVRLSADEIEALDAIATRDQVSRSEAIRRALAQFAA
ncbi:CopG family transcriptional regulator [Luteococcus sp. H138]|uniref:ribbon-helix-helix domain-containing protein n=1 Tax=unclassified Luteococcus TaxID=2639923 RepID=UPI00313BA412